MNDRVRARNLAAVVMAAGRGTRMRDPSKAKVLYEIDGRPMIHFVADLAFDLGASRVIIIVGYQREAVTEYVRRSHPEVECVVQAEQLGTGHAVMQSERALNGFEGDVVVLSGDVPLLTRESMNELLVHHAKSGAVATILTAEFEDPTGYGRIIRNSDGSVEKIVEHKDASAGERTVREINSGIYVFDKVKLFNGLSHITQHNVQHEYYLTDVFEYFWRNKWMVSALKASHPDEIRGVNTFDQLEEVKRVLMGRKL
ncbi:MAG TPA: sugar phosphate nucleotidyltransferase [Bacteroidota bacterium]|nr:sugar phosphate nucleotidyltransferase [Bacteroidota bacterium]